MEDSFVTYYDVLEIPPSASQEEVSAAYRALARQYHPDRFASIPHHLSRIRRDAEAKWYEIQEAWSLLSDPAKRREYDKALEARK